MKIELTERQYRYLLDLVYIGNWVLNSTREDDRIQEYDQRVLILPPTYSHLTVLAFPYTRALNLHRAKGLYSC